MQLDCNEILKRIEILGFKVGNVITYKDVCNILNVESKTGSTKKKHMTDVKQFMNLEQVGRGKFEIVEIYDNVQERDDKRKSNGHYDKFNEILGDDRGHRQRTIPLDLLYRVYSVIHFAEYVRKQHDMTLYQFIHSELFALIDDVDDDLPVELSNEQLFRHLELYNGYSQQILLNKVDLKYKHIDLLVGCSMTDKGEVEVVQVAMNNLYNSIKSKVLCDYAQCDKVIHCHDCEIDFDYERIATQCDKCVIREVEQCVLDEYNDKFNRSLKVYGDIYNKVTNKQRLAIQKRKQELLSVEIKNYSFDKSSVFINKSIRSDIECLIECLGDLLEVTEQDFNKFIEQLKRDIWTLFYDNEVQRISKHYDARLDKLRQCKHFGSRKLIENVEHEKCVALKLLDLCLQKDLTSKDIQIILQMIE